MKFAKTLLALMFAAISFAATPYRETLTGHVSDASGNALAGATITIQELDRTAIANANGDFSFDDVPGGEYTVVVRRPGFKSAVQRVTLPGGTPVKATLEQNALRLPDVSITASRSPLTEFASPLPMSSPSSETLRRNPGMSLAHVIDGLPGVRALTTGGQIGKPVIRGFAGSRTLVMQNGLRLEDYSWSDEDGPSVDARLADRIEVLRGPSSLLYGSDAMGGVVNVIPAPLPEGANRTKGGVELSFSSNAPELGTVLQAEGVRNGMGWRITGLGRIAEPLNTPAGELKNTGYGAFNGQAAVGWHGDWGTASLRFDQHGGEFKLLEANGPPPGLEGADEGPERKTADQRVQFIGNFPMKHFRLEPKLQWQRHWLAELADAAEVGGSGFVETTIFDLMLNTFSADVLLHADPTPRLRTTFGASGVMQSNDSRAPSPGLPFVPDASINTIAGFGVGQLQLGRVSVLGGARIDHRSLSADATPTLSLDATDLSDNAFSGNIGFAIPVTKALTLSANAGRAWRAPNLFELFANGPLLAEGRYVIGNPELKPEFGMNIDGGLKWTNNRVRLEVSAFSNHVDDYVFLQPTTETKPKPGSSSGETLQVFRYQAAKAVVSGAEAGVQISATDHLTLRGRYDMVRGKNDDSDDDLPLMPAPRVDAEAELHSAHFRSVGRAYLSFGIEHDAKQDHPNDLDFVTDAYTLLNIGAGFEPSIMHHTLHVDLRVKNAANTEYKSFLSRYKEFALNPGRDILIRVSTGF